MLEIIKTVMFTFWNYSFDFSQLTLLNISCDNICYEEINIRYIFSSNFFLKINDINHEIGK